jgi:hypothetical protein
LRLKRMEVSERSGGGPLSSLTPPGLYTTFPHNQSRSSTMCSFFATAALVLPALISAAAPPPHFVAPPPGPAGGLGLNMTPLYTYMSDFDFQSLNLALKQEWIELDLFRHALAKFSVAEFEEAGITAEDRYLIEYMADQEVGHAAVIQDMLQNQGAKQCKYQCPFKTVREFIDFTQKVRLRSALCSL